MTIAEILELKESEDNVEFKEAKGRYHYKGDKKSVLGYTVALANEGGGRLILGIKETAPYTVVGSKAYDGEEGQLEQDVYRDLKIRIRTEVINDTESGNRVLVIHVPARPVGKPLYFQDVPLMRVGDGLTRMSDEVYLSIIQEQEPDFSAKICSGLSLDDLDSTAISVLKEKYAAKQNNQRFVTLTNEQVLADLELTRNGSLTYAALLLVGNEEAIRKHLPQAKTIVEFRNSEAQIPYDWREEYGEGVILGIDKIWSQIHSRNSKIPIRQGPYIEDMVMFNEEVIREAVLNAITHRDYTITSETFIRQFPNRIQISNSGGFPKGVTLENILTVNSTPRSRLMADVLLKVGLVERSGQGVDKIFAITISEGKHEPDYSYSDAYQVSLQLNCEVKDLAFYLFLKEVQGNRITNEKLGVQEIITLAKIRDGISVGLKDEQIKRLDSEGLIVRVGSGHSKRYVLGRLYEDLLDQTSRIGNYVITEVQTIVSILVKQPDARMGDFVRAFEGKSNRSQVKYLVDKLLNDKVVEKTGKGKATRYQLGKSFPKSVNTWSSINQHLRSKHTSQ